MVIVANIVFFIDFLLLFLQVENDL